ncbi:hypothetical protein KSF_048710 [Reticulibacter mediterranei]|uniref:DUF488 domain-containing protein n=1 Tax=Reticulibacter mediterranei TaxID=2778369 RepID=A0A8J3N3W3_9CHLR|nr:hypothetical protein [Reticulibacter mediterranei]GHO94823.1 hypothetical protein KSF_048710 [Reticulibacter mediterranei]
MNANHMQVYPCGYSRDAALIRHLMQTDPWMLLIDTRYTPRSQMPAWNEAALRATYGARYRWAGKYLGNQNHARGGPISLRDAETGIGGLIRYLREGYPLILLCGCREYSQCHVSMIVSLLQAVLSSVQVILPETLPQPESVQCISVRQPWTWILTHPEIVQTCGMPPKAVENRDWSTRYRGLLYLHAGSQVDETLFHPDGQLDHAFWQWRFGEPGTRLAERMPQTKEAYSRKAIVGKAELVDVVEESDSPWFLGRYGLILNQAQPFGPILNYPGARKLFAVPQTVIEQREDKTA